MAKENGKTIQWVQQPDKCQYGFLTHRPYVCQESPHIHKIDITTMRGNGVSQEDAVQYPVPKDYVEYAITFFLPESEEALVSALSQASYTSLSAPPSVDGERTLMLGSELNKQTFVPSVEAMLNVVDRFAPFPDNIKISIAHTCGLDTSHLVKGTAAANICYVTRMAGQISRQNGDVFPAETVMHIGKFADTNRILSITEADRAAIAGLRKPEMSEAEKEEAKKETKGEFTRKILDEYQTQREDTNLSK